LKNNIIYQTFFFNNLSWRGRRRCYVSISSRSYNFSNY